MKVVIQCAARKNNLAGYARANDGRRVVFVAQPQLAPKRDDLLYASPDDLSDRQMTWRKWVQEYNKTPENNPLDLFPAYKLYQKRIYGKLVENFGVEHTYILSAGWGLIRADFLIPQYDITFSSRAASYKRRRRSEYYEDFCMLPNDGDGPVRFFGGQDYVPLFSSLTQGLSAERVISYNSEEPPHATGCRTERFGTIPYTNWHYQCACCFIQHEKVVKQ